jgi:hypothetical protein
MQRETNCFAYSHLHFEDVELGEHTIDDRVMIPNLGKVMIAPSNDVRLVHIDDDALAHAANGDLELIALCRCPCITPFGIRRFIMVNEC